MKKLNMYDIVPVTPPKARLEELLIAEEVLECDYEIIEELHDLDENMYEGVLNILKQRKELLADFKSELAEEMKVTQSNARIFEEIVNFKDLEVEQAVRGELDIFDRPITKNDMRAIKKIFIEGCHSLEGLQYAENIEELCLTWTDIFTDIESDRDTAIIFSIIRPSLKKIKISHSVISKYTALSVLKNLKSISVTSNYSGYFDFAIFGLLRKMERLIISEKSVSPKVKVCLNENPQFKEGMFFV